MCNMCETFIERNLRPQKRRLVKFLKKKITLHTSNSPNRLLKKAFFQNLTSFRFCVVDYVLWISKACYTYEKCLLGSNLSSDIFETIIRHTKISRWQEKAMFVDFKKTILWHSKLVFWKSLSFLQFLLHSSKFKVKFLETGTK